MAGLWDIPHQPTSGVTAHSCPSHTNTSDSFDLLLVEEMTQKKVPLHHWDKPQCHFTGGQQSYGTVWERKWGRIEMADDVLKRQGRMKQAGRGAGCKYGNIFNTIHTLAHFPCSLSESWSVLTMPCP